MLWNKASRICLGGGAADYPAGLDHSKPESQTKTPQPLGGRASPPDATGAVITDPRGPLASGPKCGRPLTVTGSGDQEWQALHRWEQELRGPQSREQPWQPHAEHMSGLGALRRPGHAVCQKQSFLQSKYVLKKPKDSTYDPAVSRHGARG